jgi:hypothetical protein
MRRVLVVLAVVIAVAVAFVVGALVFRDQGEEGWSEADEKKFLDSIVEPEHTETHYDTGRCYETDTGEIRCDSRGPLVSSTRVVPGNEERAACTLDVYEQYFSTYDAYADSSDDSPTLLKADAAAQRKCD